MTVLAAVLLAMTSAQVDSVGLTTLNSKLAVRVMVSGAPGMVAVHREGDVARVSIMDAALGLRFAGGQRFSWTPSDGFDPALLAATPARLDRLELVASGSEVSLLLHVPPEVSVDARRDSRGVLIVFRTGEPEPARVAVAEPRPTLTPPVAAAPPPPVATQPPPAAATPRPAAVAAEPAVEAPAVEPAAGAAAPAPGYEQRASAPPPATETAALARQLFPTAPGVTQGGGEPTGSEPVASLYSRLFPAGAPEPAPEAAPAAEVIEPGQDVGLLVGPFRVRASVDARYVDADTFVEATAVPTRDKYLEVQPRVAAVAPVGAGSFTLDYAPVFRTFATYDQVNSSSHELGAGIELPVGERVSLRARDRFRSGVLDTRIVDPGGEYFFNLGRFHRNDIDGGASIMVGPRLSVELAGGGRSRALRRAFELLRLRHPPRFGGARPRADAHPQGGGLLRLRHRAAPGDEAGSGVPRALGPGFAERRDPAPPHR